MGDVTDVREAHRTLLQKEKYSLLESIDVRFGRYVDIVVVNRSFRNFDRKKIRSKRNGATDSTITGAKGLFSLQYLSGQVCDRCARTYFDCQLLEFSYQLVGSG
jgi:hypothetical protein